MPGPKGARARERNAWELNHVVGRLAREISRCESAHTHTETVHIRELPVHIEAARTKPVHVYTVSRSRGISERIAREIIRSPFSGVTSFGNITRPRNHRVNGASNKARTRARARAI